MTLRYFETELNRSSTDLPAAPAGVTNITISSGSDAQVMTPAGNPFTSSTDLMKDGDGWEWRELRDYVNREIEARFGVQPHPYPEREASTFKAFAARWPNAAEIAKHAFEVCDGWWGGAPISVNRFCKASDPYFAGKIAEKIQAIASR